MYYNINNQTFLENLPETIRLKNGTLVTGDLTYDKKALSDSGYFWVKDDSPTQPANSQEDISQRKITFYDTYVTVERVWTTVVPPTISARQIRLWLIENDIGLDSVENAIDSIQDLKLREKTKVEWEYAPYIERSHPLIESLGLYLGLDKNQIDNAFISASTL